MTDMNINSIVEIEIGEHRLRLTRAEALQLRDELGKWLGETHQRGDAPYVIPIVVDRWHYESPKYWWQNPIISTTSEITGWTISENTGGQNG